MPANTRWSPRLFVPTTLPAALLLTGTPLPWSFARSLPPRLRAASFGPLSVLMGNEICRSIVASESGPAATARPWAGIFRDLRASRCAELCGPCSVTAATRVVPLCSRQRSLPSVSLAGEPLPEQILGLAGRLDDLEGFHGMLGGARLPSVPREAPGAPPATRQAAC